MRADDHHVNETRPQAGRLSAGPIRRWVRGKPRLAATSTGTLSAVTVDAKPANSFTYNIGVLSRALVVLVGFTVAIAAATWFILVTTVLATANVNGTVWVVQRSAWVQGQAPVGSTALVNSSTVPTDLPSRVSEIFTGYPQASVVEVMAAPTQEVVTNIDGHLIVDGEDSGYVVSTPIEPTTLKDEYLTQCLSGSCGAAGEPYKVPVQNVYGKVLSGLTLHGLVSPPASTMGGK